MQKEMKREAAGYLARSHRRRLWKKIVGAMGCVVVFCTTYALILPALTMENAVYCGLEPHQHSEACYEETLVCGLEEGEASIHVHTAECYAEEKALTCGQEEGETVLHQHSAECYTEQRTLTCGQAEAPSAHTHTEECFGTVQNLICEDTDPEHQHTDECYETAEVCLCGLEEGEEVPGHTHTDECYTVQRTLTCGLEEGEEIPGHTHTDECYTVQQTLACGLEEGQEIPGHTHTEECRQRVLICEKEEHTHSLACRSDPEADVETPEDWEAAVAAAELTGRRRDDLLAVAETQLGYTESTRNYKVGEDGETRQGYTRYGAWQGDAYGDWSAAFVSFCLHYAGIPEDVFPRGADCARWVEALQSAALYHEKGAWAPQAGDLVFLDADGDGLADRAGILTEKPATPETAPDLTAIEGDADGCVRRVDYAREDAGILGYGELPAEAPAEYTWSQDNLEVVMTVPQGEALPENAGLKVEVLDPAQEGNEYSDKYAAAQAAVSAEEPQVIMAFDIVKVSLEADGQEILPQKEATVQLRLGSDPEIAPPHTEILRYAADGTAVTAANLREEEGATTASFDTSLTAEYALVGAADLLADGDTGTAARDASEEPVLTPHKTIDALRDGADNPDTNLDNTDVDKTDLYRLYLDAQISGHQEPIDLLLVVDQSGSMHMNYGVNWFGQLVTYPDDDSRCVRDMTDDNNNPIFRDQAMQLILNGTYGNDFDAKKQDGLIYQFLAANPQNNIAAVGFQGAANYGTRYDYYPDTNTDNAGGVDGVDLVGWTSGAENTPRVDVNGQKANATNYCAGILQAERMLERLQGNGHKKVMLFISDGIPTCSIAQRATGTYYREGTGNSTSNATNTNTNTYYQNLLTTYRTNVEGNEKLTVHTIGISSAESNDRLTSMATDGGGQFFAVSETDALRKALKKLMFGTVYSEVKIEDTLSQYVDLYSAVPGVYEPDYKVVMKDLNGSETVLYQNGSITADGQGVLTSVGYDPATKKVSAVFDPSFTPPPGYTVTLSFNVQLNRKGYEEYAQNGYGTTAGDSETDFTSNTTSSSQAGLYSNAQATVTYKKDDVEDSQTYPRPVVQAAVCRVVLEKVNSRNPAQTLAGAEFTLYREAFEGETGQKLEGRGDTLYVAVQAGLTTDENGRIVMDGLIPGDYCLVETKAPEHYQNLKAPVAFTLTRAADGTGRIAGSTATIELEGETLPLLTVANIPWEHELPQAGGHGSGPYTMAGLLLTAAAAHLLYKSKKRRKEDSASS